MKEYTPWNGTLYKTSERTSPQSYNPTSILNAWHDQIASQPGLHIILDIDENLTNTVSYWVRASNRFLRMYGSVASNRLPTVEEVCQEGGPSVYYPGHFPDVFDSPELYEKLMDEWRHRRGPNYVSRPMHQDMTWIYHQIRSKANFLGAITARSATEVVIGATQDLLTSLSLPQFPIIYKSPSTPLSAASSEKLVHLERLVEGSPQGRVVLIDDSISTAELVAQRNRRSPRLAQLMYILNASGPLTKPILNRGEFTVSPGDGIVIMESWEHLPIVLNGLKT